MTSAHRPATASTRPPPRPTSCSTSTTTGSRSGPSRRRLVRALEDLDPDAVRADAAVLDQVELDAADSVGEEALARAQNGGEDHQPQLVHQVVLEQRVDEGAAARDQDVPVGLVAELAELVWHVL